MSHRAALETRWEKLWSGIAERRGPFAPGPDPPPPSFDLIAAAYSAPGRHYHNLDHLTACFSELDHAIAVGPVANAVAVELALWFHDVVYDPARGDNEQESARAAAAVINKFGTADGGIDDVTRLIINTRHDRPPGTPDGRLIVDIDLSILGQPPEVFDAYDRAIRREYAYVPDDAFAAGRAKVLRNFLARPEIYLTASFRDRYEASARDNLARAVQRWERSPRS